MNCLCKDDFEILTSFWACFDFGQKNIYRGKCKVYTNYTKNQSKAMWCSDYLYRTTWFNKDWTHVLHRYKSCSWRVGDSRWWDSLTVVPVGNKTKHHSLVNHTTKKILYNHYCWKLSKYHVFFIEIYYQENLIVPVKKLINGLRYIKRYRNRWWGNTCLQFNKKIIKIDSYYPETNIDHFYECCWHGHMYIAIDKSNREAQWYNSILEKKEKTS